MGVLAPGDRIRHDYRRQRRQWQDRFPRISGLVWFSESKEWWCVNLVCQLRNFRACRFVVVLRIRYDAFISETRSFEFFIKTGRKQSRTCRIRDDMYKTNLRDCKCK